jgi:hypothetical protein
MGVTRRTFLGGVLGAAGTAALVGLDPFPARRALALPTPTAAGTTLDQVIIRGAAGAGGYTPLVFGAGEPFLRRTDLGGLPAGGANARALACFGRLTDVHVTDVQSPARFEYFDGYGSVPGLSDLTSAYRPQELLSMQVGDAMIAQMRQVQRGPATERPVEFAIVTGDNTDNCQFNEPRWYIDLLDGQVVRPDSGDLAKYEGVMDDVAPDPYFWHPESGFGAPSSVFRLPDGARAARCRPRTLPGDRPRLALVRGLRQPRRARAGQRGQDAFAAAAGDGAAQADRLACVDPGPSR